MVDRRAHSRGPWLAVAMCSLAVANSACEWRSTPPAALNDREFWGLVHGLSEPDGTFTLSDNFVSNEPGVAENARRLRASGGVYLGVGPEQNFSYIARLRPTLAFIVDIRRENRNLHLLYKALFEISADRLDFVSALFSRPRSPGPGSALSANEIFARLEGVEPSPEQYATTAALVRARLITARGFPLDSSDLDQIDRAFKAFYSGGPHIRFWGPRDVDAIQPTYRQLMTARDARGQTRSFLETEEAFQFVKDLQTCNRVIPVIGDFGGPSALRHVGDYIRGEAEVVQAFYGSNVGVYLSRRQEHAFCSSLGALPVAPRAWFIDRSGVRSMASQLRTCRTDAAGGAASR